jgi:hypothetical protein
MPFTSFAEAVAYCHGKAYQTRRDIVVLLDAVSRRLWALIGPHRPFVKLPRHREWFRVTGKGIVVPGKVCRQTVLALVVAHVLSVDDADMLLSQPQAD